MKRLTVILLLLVFLVPDNSSLKAAVEPFSPVGVSFQVFYDGLSPYGRWVSYPGYGYVWAPAIGIDFIPYSSGGHWVYTDEGWVWVSDYDWGWAPFHYGRWFYDDGYGWMWVPGYDWAPSWVVWGWYGGYCGWAPIAPGISFYAGYRPDIRYWTFVPGERITAANVHSYRVQNTTLINNINKVTVVNNAGQHNNAQYFAGPKPAEVEKVTGTKITPVKLAESGKPGTAKVLNNQLAVYRPSVSKSAATPAHVTKLESLTPVRKSSSNPAPAKTNAAPAHSNPVQPERKSPAQPVHNNVAQPTHNNPGRNPVSPPSGSNNAVHQSKPERQAAPPNHEPVQRSEPQPPPHENRNMQPREPQPQHMQPPPQQMEPHQPQHMEPAQPHMQPPLRETRPMGRPSSPPLQMGKPHGR